jgi:hypothetical protein
MADFAKFATACEGAFATPGAFKIAYERNRTDATEAQLCDDPVAAALQKLELPWSGRAAVLLIELKAVAADASISAKDLPKDAKALTRHLHRLQPLLREKGIAATHFRTNTVRGWMIEEMDPDPDELPSQTSPVSVRRRKATKGDDRDDGDDTSVIPVRPDAEL